MENIINRPHHYHVTSYIFDNGKHGDKILTDAQYFDKKSALQGIEDAITHEKKQHLNCEIKRNIDNTEIQIISGSADYIQLYVCFNNCEL